MARKNKLDTTKSTNAKSKKRANHQENGPNKPLAIEALEQLQSLEVSKNKLKKIKSNFENIMVKIPKTNAKKKNSKLIFKFLDLDFYIDFVYSANKPDQERLEGLIRYGCSNTKIKDPDKKDKVFFECRVTANGFMNPDDIKGEWIINNKTKASDIANLHSLILKKIWKKALSWSNEFRIED